MFSKMKDKFEKATSQVKDFDYKKAIQDGKESFGEAFDKARTLSDESIEALKSRMDRDNVKDEQVFEEGFDAGRRSVLDDMIEGVAKGPSHYFNVADKSFKGDYRQGYKAGVDSAYGDL